MHIHTYTYIHKHMQTYSPIHIHITMLTNTNTCTYADTDRQLNMTRHSHMHIKYTLVPYSELTHRHTCRYSQTYTLTHKFILTYTFICPILTYILTPSHSSLAHRHTFIGTRTNILLALDRLHQSVNTGLGHVTRAHLDSGLGMPESSRAETRASLDSPTKAYT